MRSPFDMEVLTPSLHVLSAMIYMWRNLNKHVQLFIDRRAIYHVTSPVITRNIEYYGYP